MSEVKFPYQGWVLTPSFKPVEKTFVSGYAGEWHDTSSNQMYHILNIYRSKTEAILSGRSKLEAQQAALDKKQANIEKRRAALDKASA